MRPRWRQRLIASLVLMSMRNRSKRSAEVFEQRRHIEPPPDRCHQDTRSDADVRAAER